jgi:hypothetical protein
VAHRAGHDPPGRQGTRGEPGRPRRSGALEGIPLEEHEKAAVIDSDDFSFGLERIFDGVERLVEQRA